MTAFPARLLPFERYMLADDRPAYPMTFGLRLPFAGRLDPDRLRAAARAVLPAHPLLAARVGRGPRWVDAGPHAVPLAAGDPPAGPLPLDLTAAVGWRGWLTAGGDGDVLTLHFHHACTDGLGALAFVADWLAAADGLHPVRPAAAGLREPPAPVAHWRRLPHDLARVARYYRAAPHSLAAAPPLAPPRPVVVPARVFGCDETAAVQRAARAAGATVNDLLLRALFATLFVRRGAATGPVRVALAVNLRAGPARQAANDVSLVFVDRRPAAGLLASVSREVAAVRRLGTGHALHRVLRVATAVPGGVALAAGAGCAATAVLSNVGRVAAGPWRVGGAAVTGVELHPPIRPRTPAAFGVATFAGRLSLSLVADAAAFTPDGAAGLLAAFATELLAGPPAGAGRGREEPRSPG